ncbi:MAG: YceI family protein [Verrucomicrobia bacterium]|nr:YceI family protein [Verrucomicrobiota bacterium]
MRTTTPFATVLGTLLCSMFAVSAATLEVDQTRSKLQVDAKATGHAFSGTLKNYTVKATGDTSKLKPESLELSWNFSDLDTDDKGRDAEMLKWLGGGAPKGNFKFVKFWTDKDGVDHAQGTLTIHGVAKTVYFPFTVKKDGAWVTASGKVELDYKDFGLPLVRAMLVMTVDPKLVVNFQLVGKVK